MKTHLCLADGRIFAGVSAGLAGETSGEIVFNTSMTGYQEILTDPTYSGQIIVMTYPLIGNYGVNKEDRESLSISARGLIVREICPQPSNYRTEQTLHRYLVDQGIVALSQVDTRALTRHLRLHGSQQGLISLDDDFDRLRARAAALTPTPTPDLIRGITVSARRDLPENPAGPRVALIDFGGRDYLINALHALGCAITLLPPDSTFNDIRQCTPAGVLLSDGPGNPQELPDICRTITQILAQSLPLMGVGLGHQLLGLALGGRVRPLIPGHRGANHPIRGGGRIHITAQNHGFALEGPFTEGTEITHIHLNDKSIEGLACPSRQAFSLQFVPDTQPGPHTTHYLYEHFRDLLLQKGYASHA
ncbi:MAG: glutamine-hydrolyzing carbamoyl-phosphate synthase small subunit [Peptococcaceae bacterium]|nr:glutamine-hydrolyzing carbamoyl-phosphate synthase small subunit [Peptococcaceae bacterium]